MKNVYILYYIIYMCILLYIEKNTASLKMEHGKITLNMKYSEISKPHTELQKRKVTNKNSFQILLEMQAGL